MLELKKSIFRSYLLVTLTFSCFVLHNVFYALLEIEEPVFFSLTFIFFLAFIISLVFNLIKDKPKDLWKLAGIGFFSLLAPVFNFEQLYWFTLFFFFLLFELCTAQEKK